MQEKESANENVISLKGMYKEYFLDYASYVILERAVPAINDGLKPVQRRIMHAMKEMDDGRFHKVANIIGQTMQYHPHGDAAIGDALVNLGQKDLMIDCQGNWGDVRTGDGAAAARYIEARLTKFGLDVLFNPQTTEWQLSYDGRKKEPITLPSKFPLLLAQGVEGIAVGLSTKIMPHNFIELCKAAIRLLEGKNIKLYPDFQTGGTVDVENYNDGKRGGKIRVRATIEIVDKKTLAIKELPYATTTQNLIDSILKANDKGKIKIKKVIDNTAADVEILVELASGVSPEVAIDALYAFTNCEISISPNACVIIDNKPHFLKVEDILRTNTEQTKALLKLELEIRRMELLEKLMFSSLEKIFIENRIYREIEEAETWEAVLQIIEAELEKYVSQPKDELTKSDKRIPLYRNLTEDDIVRLTEIKIKRISKFNTFKADELILKLEEELKEVEYNLEHLTAYAIAFFENILTKYGKGKERKTKIASFENIVITQVVANNAKLYVNRKEGFIGSSLKKDEFVSDCSDIDNVIVFRKDGKFTVTKVQDKVFVGKSIIHVAVWKKGNERTTYNLAYLDGKTGKSYVKRFNVTSITRDKEYDLTQGHKGSKLLYFSVNPNGESELIHVQLTQSATARNKQLEYNFGDLDIKGRGVKGNMLTKYPVHRVSLKSVGASTLGALKIWMDTVSGRLNTKQRGKYLGEFDTGDTILALYKDGTYEQTDFEQTNRFDVVNLLNIVKLKEDTVISAVHYDGGKKWTLVKRFKLETSSLNQKFSYISEEKNSKLLFVTINKNPRIEYNMKVNSQKIQGELNLTEFIDVKGWKAMGNKLSDQRLTNIKEVEDTELQQQLKAGDSVELDVDEKGQSKLF